MKRRTAERFEGGVIAATLCFVFGLALIANVHPVGDGLWFWYGNAVLHHERLYTDLHLNLQPLFVLLTAAFQGLFGTSWLASKILPVLQLLAYCVGLVLVSRFVPWRGWQRGLLIGAAFVLAITPPLARFDDYHVTTQCFQVYSIYLLLLIWRGLSARRGLVAAGLVGILCGLSVSTRINDGAALFLGCLLALPFLVSNRRVLHVLIFCAAAPAALLGVIAMTRDTLSMWMLETVSHAAGIKGGAGSLLSAPLLFPYRIVKATLEGRTLMVLLAVFVAFLLLAWCPDALRRGERLRTKVDILVAAFLLLLLAAGVRLGWSGAGSARLAQLGVVALMGLGGWVLVALLRSVLDPVRLAREDWNPLQVLLLIPFWGPFATAMSAGAYMVGYEPDLAMLLLIAPFALPRRMNARWQRRGLLVIACLILVMTVPTKLMVPYAWQHYHSQRMFKQREWYRHPAYGPMIIERDQLHFMLPICQAIHNSKSPTALLAIPFPYPNYFCDVKPWHGYVQTWYDTSSRQRIETLGKELDTAPPEWIMYERGLDTITVHEQGYTFGHSLPHRELDRELMDKVMGQQWTIVRRACFEGSDWILIRTSAPGAGEHEGEPVDAANRSKACHAAEEASGRWRF